MLERKAWGRPIVPGSPGVEFAADGVTPTAVLIWQPGKNASTKGDVFFTARSADLIMAAFKERSMPLMWDYDHESTVPPEERKAAAASGFGCAATVFSTIELRGADGAGADGFDQALWSTRIQWTDEAQRQIVAGKRRQVSPYFAVDKGTDEIIDLYSVALCFEGATNRGRILSPLQMRLFNRGKRMDEIIAALQAAVDAGDWEQVKAAIDALSSLTPAPGADVAAIKATVDESVEKAVHAALKKYGRMPAASPEAEAVRLARQAGEEAKLEVNRSRIEGLIERAGDGVLSPESTKILLSRGDVETAKMVIAEVGRHQRQRHQRGHDDPPASGGGEVVTLSEADKRAAERNGVDPAKMAAARQRMAMGRMASNGRRGG